MKIKKIVLFFLIGSIAFSCKQENQVNSEIQQSLIFAKGKKIENNNFTGNAYLEMLILEDSINQNSVGSVTFEPKARTNWHFHPNGQIILAISGEGYYQEKGSPKKVLKKGDAVKCPPNIPHWHGATENSEFVQIAITSRINGATQWLEAVSDEKYSTK